MSGPIDKLPPPVVAGLPAPAAELAEAIAEAVVNTFLVPEYTAPPGYGPQAVESSPDLVGLGALGAASSYGAPSDFEVFDPAGLSPEQVQQGAQNDCWFMAPMAAEALSGPETLASGIAPGDGPNTFDVRLYLANNDTGAIEPVWIPVTADLPTDASGRPVFAQAPLGSDGQPMVWAALYEKALAQVSGGYDGIGLGDPAVGYTVLTGRPAVDVQVGDLGNSQLGELLALSAGDYNLTVGTFKDTDPSTGWKAGHSYAVMGTANAPNGVPYVLLRDPWGDVAGPPPRGSVDLGEGSFAVPVSALRGPAKFITLGQ
jgi:hypothetical protein